MDIAIPADHGKAQEVGLMLVFPEGGYRPVASYGTMNGGVGGELEIAVNPEDAAGRG